MTLESSALRQSETEAWKDAVALVLLMRSVVPFELVAGLAREFGAVECFWRESDRSFTGFVAEVWFVYQPKQFAVKWAAVVGYPVKVLAVSHAAPGRVVGRVPVGGVHGQVKLGWPSRDSRVWLRH